MNVISIRQIRCRKGWLVPWLMLIALGIMTPTGQAMTSDSGATTVTFNIAEAIEVTAWPLSTVSLEPSSPGVPSVSNVQIISVRSNARWGIQVSAENADGMLREFDIGESIFVSNGRSVGPLQWATNVNGPWTAVSSTPEVMYSDQEPTGQMGTDVGFVLRVTPSFDDEPLPAGRDYRTVLIYTAGVGF